MLNDSSLNTTEGSGQCQAVETNFNDVAPMINQVRPPPYFLCVLSPTLYDCHAGQSWGVFFLEYIWLGMVQHGVWGWQCIWAHFQKVLCRQDLLADDMYDIQILPC